MTEEDVFKAFNGKINKSDMREHGLKC